MKHIPHAREWYVPFFVSFLKVAATCSPLNMCPFLSTTRQPKKPAAPIQVSPVYWCIPVQSSRLHRVCLAFCVYVCSSPASVPNYIVSCRTEQVLVSISSGNSITALNNNYVLF